MTLRRSDDCPCNRQSILEQQNYYYCSQH